MPRLSSERVFKSHFPKATVERHSTTGGDVYFLVRVERCAYSPCGEGHTRAQAWADACKRKGLSDAKEQE